MGRRSPELKRVKRCKQKARRKLLFKDTSRPQDLPTEHSNYQPQTDSEAPSGTDEAVGEDIGVFLMTLEDSIQRLDTNASDYSEEFLMECRDKLMQKVIKYHKQYESAVTENSRLIHNHRQEVERIRKFYQNLVYALRELREL